MRNLWNGRKYFVAKYGRTKDLTGKELSVSFTDILQGFFQGVWKTEPKVRFSDLENFPPKTAL